MDISGVLTLSSRQDVFGEYSINFIKNLMTSGLTVLQNPISTQIYGEYVQGMPVLNVEIKTSLGLMDMGLLKMKIVKSNRSDYEPHF